VWVRLIIDMSTQKPLRFLCFTILKSLLKSPKLHRTEVSIQILADKVELVLSDRKKEEIEKHIYSSFLRALLIYSFLFYKPLFLGILKQFFQLNECKLLKNLIFWKENANAKKNALSLEVMALASEVIAFARQHKQGFCYILIKDAGCFSSRELNTNLLSQLAE
jgi:hypothetical protein